MNKKELLDKYRKLEIYPGYSCSRSCRFCFVSREDRIKYARHMPLRKLCETVYKAYQSGTSYNDKKRDKKA